MDILEVKNVIQDEDIRYELLNFKARKIVINLTAKIKLLENI